MNRFKQYATAGLALTIMGFVAGCGTTQVSPTKQGANTSKISTTSNIPNTNLSNSSGTTNATTYTSYQKWHVSKSQITWDQNMYNKEKNNLAEISKLMKR